MNLLNRLSKQATELWQKHVECQDVQQKALLLKQYREIYGQYLKHKEWLKLIQL